MSIGERAIIAGFQNKDRKYREQLLSMGLVKDTEFISVLNVP